MPEIRVTVLVETARVISVAQQGPPGPSKYSLYAALLTQAGTAAPTVTVTKNELSGAGVWSYVAVGRYRFTLAGAFVSTKILLFHSIGIYNGAASMQASVIDDNTIEVNSYAGVNLADDVLTDASLEIHIYP